MSHGGAEQAFSTLVGLVSAQPALEEALRVRWQADGRPDSLPAEVRAAADALSAALAPLTLTADGVATLSGLLHRQGAELILTWCTASAWRRDAHMAPLLTLAAGQPAHAERVAAAARQRVVAGPLGDALECAPFIGDGEALRKPECIGARSRMEILIWEAGASALEIPQLGRWLWDAPSTFDELIQRPAHGALRGRVLAARCLEICAGGMVPGTSQELIGQTLRVLQPLILHPEPLVWIHAARALGRLAGPLDHLEGMLLDWVLGDSPVLRQRAITGFASLPATRLTMLASQLVAIIAEPHQDAWVLAAVAAATPYLFFERRDLWNRLAKRVLAGDGGAISARALARGLATLWRRGAGGTDVEASLHALREMARRARPESFDDLRRWIEVTAVTDVIHGAERDPLDLELGLDNLMRIAAQYDDEEADARAARFAGTLAPTFHESRRLVLGGARPRVRAAAINALEGSARALALRLWAPLLATHPSGEPIEEPNLADTWAIVARAPSEILDLLKEGKQTEAPTVADDKLRLSLEVLAIHLGGYALDACGEEMDLGPGRGPTAHDTCLWLRKIDGLADGSRELPSALKTALSKLLWRLVDTTRGSTLGEVDDVRWLGPFAAWWGLVIDRPTMLLPLATTLPMMAAGALERCCTEAETLRTAVSSGAIDGGWGPAVGTALAALHADDTEIAHALAGLARALKSFSAAAGMRPNLEPLCQELVQAAERLQAALADPMKGLHPAGEQHPHLAMEQKAAENAPRIASLVARAIRAREISLLDVWLASLGPVASALLDTAVRNAIRRTPPPPPMPKKPEPKLIAGYELVKPLGAGGIGSVYLVRKPGADRYFVLKIPKSDVLANCNDVEREGILKSFVEEATALAGLYHPNVANIIDRGVATDVPFLILEYLIGADLKVYSTARKMTLFELRQVVLDSCAGLAALHSAGLVHRDIKPANLWLRLPLAGGVSFDPHKHRDPALAAPLATVVIDFGMVRASRVAAEVGGRFVAGTAGYMAPEQVLDPVELDPRADVYSLAASIYNVTTGRAFFDEIENHRERIMAHMRQDPFEDPERLRDYPAELVRLLRAATAREPQDRPSPLEFGRAFVAAL